MIRTRYTEYKTEWEDDDVCLDKLSNCIWIRKDGKWHGTFFKVTATDEEVDSAITAGGTRYLGRIIDGELADGITHRNADEW
jgi:hypothetical protein